MSDELEDVVTPTGYNVEQSGQGRSQRKNEARRKGKGRSQRKRKATQQADDPVVDGYLLGLAILIFGSRKFLQFSYFWVSQFFAKTFLTFGSRSFLERVSRVLGLSVNKIAVG